MVRGRRPTHIGARVTQAARSVDWTRHLRDLNRRYDLGGRDELTVPNEGLPPSWFVGDVEALEPGRWVLVVSLNQGSWADKDEAWRRQQRDSVQNDWDFWRLLNRKKWYGRFYSPMVRLGATALGEGVPGEREQQQEFATTRMVFVESCPYSSSRFARGGAILAGLLAEKDRGFQVLERVRRVLIEEAPSRAGDGEREPRRQHPANSSRAGASTSRSTGVTSRPASPARPFGTGRVASTVAEGPCRCWLSPSYPGARLTSPGSKSSSSVPTPEHSWVIPVRDAHRPVSALQKPV